MNPFDRSVSLGLCLSCDNCFKPLAQTTSFRRSRVCPVSVVLFPASGRQRQAGFPMDGEAQLGEQICFRFSSRCNYLARGKSTFRTSCLDEARQLQRSGDRLTQMPCRLAVCCPATVYSSALHLTLSDSTTVQLAALQS